VRVLSAGFQMHVAKPIDPDDLIAAVASLTGRICSLCFPSLQDKK
jgi:CheY-like chemotaxis protein